MMRLIQRSAAASLGLALVALASGCGSKSSTGSHSTSTLAASTATATTFINRANAICTKPHTGPSPGPFPFPSFDPLHPDRSKLPAIGRYFEHADVVPALRGQIAELKALGTPPRDQADWQRMLAAMQSNLNASAGQVQAALSSNVPVFISTVNTVTTTMSEERATALAFGARSCAPPGSQSAGPPAPRAASPKSACRMHARQRRSRTTQYNRERPAADHARFHERSEVPGCGREMPRPTGESIPLLGAKPDAALVT
jgi:hypothetical protein